MNRDEMRDTLLRCGDIDTMEAVVRSHTGDRPATRISREDVSPIETLLFGGQLTEAAALSLSLAYAHQDAFVSIARQLGVFRASRYRFQTRDLVEVVRRLQRLAEPLALTSESRTYFDSLLAFYAVSDEAARVYEQIVDAMREQRGHVLATLMLIADRAYEEDRIYTRRFGARGVKNRTCELLCGVISALMTIYSLEFGAGPDEWSGLDSHQCDQPDGSFRTLISHGHNVYELMDMELSIDGSGLVAEYVSGGVLVKRSPLGLGASIDLGYARMEEDIVSRYEAIAPIVALYGIGSLDALAATFHESLSRSVAVSPYPYGFPCAVLLPPDDPVLLTNLRREELFIEDVFTQIQMRAYRCEAPSLDPFDVGDGLMSVDLFKVARLLSVLRDAYFHREQMGADSASDEIAALKLCCMQKSELTTLLSSVVGRAKTEKILSSLLMSASETRFDLQYRPFIQVGEWVVFPLSVASSSIHPRNMEISARTHQARVRHRDPAIEGVFESMRRAGMCVEKECEFPFSGAPGDTDVLALVGDTLYILEFKNSFVPSNAHELRNTYDQLLKAARQLDVRKEWFELSENQTRVWAKLGWSGAFPRWIQTGIILSHALFHGAVIAGHPVRAADDLMRFVASGEVSVGTTRAWAWEGSGLEPLDLWRYFQPDGPCAKQLACMIHRPQVLLVGSSKVEIERWRFDETIA